MRARPLLLMTAILAAPLLSMPASADQAHIDFLNALGEPALIGANGDHELALTAYRPVPAFNIADIDANRLRLGFDLFHETRLSIDNSTGCNSCHSGMFGGTDGRKVSTGARGALGNLNAPTTFNAAYNFRQFWDGRAVDLKEQALGPIVNEIEMAHTLDGVLDMLRNDSNYPAEFASVYADGVTAHNMADAIAYFQTVNFSRASTPFVRHLAGEDGQLSEQALRGWQRFDELGCASCHNGINLGGNSYQQLGAGLSYYVEHRTPGPHDDGLIGRSGRANDLHVFKVPTLHGIAETGPYFHDGSIETLESAIEEMGEHQLGRLLSDEDIDDIAAFLRSLGGRPMGGMAMGSMGMGRGMGMAQGSGPGMGRGMGQGMSGGMQGMGGGMRRMQGNASEADAGTPAVFTATSTHAADYAHAIRITADAVPELIAEMRRVHSGAVAHYDFIQFQHLELIRHARSLQHPPASLQETTRAQLSQQASELLQDVNALEWTIADFLRAEAMIRVMTSHINEPEDSELSGEMGDPALLREQHSQIAQRMIEMASNSTVAARIADFQSSYLAAQ
jgi:cytochrome c peroxidase